MNRACYETYETEAEYDTMETNTKTENVSFASKKKNFFHIFFFKALEAVPPVRTEPKRDKKKVPLEYIAIFYRFKSLPKLGKPPLRYNLFQFLVLVAILVTLLLLLLLVGAIVALLLKSDLEEPQIPGKISNPMLFFVKHQPLNPC